MEAVVLLIVVMFLVPIWAVKRELEARTRPDYWRRWGAVVLKPRALQAQDRPIGSYMGTEIFDHVRFADCDYRFDHVAPSEERDLIKGGELFLEPGLVYRLEGMPTSRRRE